MNPDALEFAMRMGAWQLIAALLIGIDLWFRARNEA